MADIPQVQQVVNSIEPLRQLNRPPIMIPRMVSQAGTFMVLSYFMMKVMNMLKDRDGSISKLQSGGIPQERAEIIYFAHVICSLAGIVFSRSLRVGGDEFDDTIVAYMKRAYNLMIGERTAEEIKITVGSAFPLEEELSMDVKGRDLSAGLPRIMTVRSEEIRDALKEPLNNILESIRLTLERCPPELSADLVDRGIVVAGGGALVRGIDQLIAKETGLPVHIADSPLTAVAEGTGKVLQELQFLRRVASSSAE